MVLRQKTCFQVKLNKDKFNRDGWSKTQRVSQSQGFRLRYDMSEVGWNNEQCCLQ